MDSNNGCPCGLPATYEKCCGRFIDQGIRPQTAELLMRSRYTAYTLCHVPYLTETWHPDHCPKLDSDELKGTHWLRLEVLHHKKGLKTSVVEFKAFYRVAGQEHCIHEISTFKKIKNRWFYLHGEI